MECILFACKNESNNATDTVKFELPLIIAKILKILYIEIKKTKQKHLQVIFFLSGRGFIVKKLE